MVEILLKIYKYGDLCRNLNKKMLSGSQKTLFCSSSPGPSKQEHITHACGQNKQFIILLHRINKAEIIYPVVIRKSVKDLVCSCSTTT